MDLHNQLGISLVVICVFGKPIEHLGLAGQSLIVAHSTGSK